MMPTTEQGRGRLARSQTRLQAGGLIDPIFDDDDVAELEYWDRRELERLRVQGKLSPTLVQNSRHAE